MRQMKDSGVEWIGIIPDKWRVSRVGNHFYFYSGDSLTNEEIRDKDKYPVYGANGIRGYYHQKNLEGANILLGRVGALCGNVHLVEEDIWVTEHALVVVPFNSDVDIGYSSMLFETMKLGRYSRASAQPVISSEILRQLRIPFPPLNEQREIYCFLQSKCSQIDSIIKKQEAIIEKLKEYKLSVITEAVTKGLDPNVEMKDSGIEWIGNIPSHWNICKLKYLFADGDDGLKIGPFGSAIKGKTLDEGPYKIYNQAHLISNDFSLSRHYVSEETFHKLENYRVKPGDVLFSMMGTIGKCQIMPEGYPDGIMDSHLLKTRLNEKMIPEFFRLAYDKDFSCQVIMQLLYMSNGTIMNGLNSSLLKNVIIAVPPLIEQKEIVEVLNTRLSDIDESIQLLTKSVVNLQEYKKSLIYEVVTGKKEV